MFKRYDAPPPLRIRITMREAIQLGVIFAVLWWALGAFLYHNPQLSPLYIWNDQSKIFMHAEDYLANPYDLAGYFNPPWVLLILTPIAILPLEAGVLVQMLLYFVGLALLVRKFGGRRREVLLLFTSALALDTAAEINIDWLVVWALLLPATYCAPFLLAKPQNAIGYVLSFRWGMFVRFSAVAVALLLLSLFLWQDWISIWLNSVDSSLNTAPNAAPQMLLGTLPSLIIGVLLAYYAWTRRDPIVGIFAGMFFVPYLAGYSLMMHFSLILARWHRVGLIVWVALWVTFITVGVLLMTPSA